MSRKDLSGSKQNRQFVNMRGLRASVCCEPDSQTGGWIRELQRERMEVSHIWPPTGRLSSDMDILICDYFPQMSDLIPWMPGDATAALIVILPQNGQYDDAVLLASAPQCVLQRPFADNLISSTAKVAWSQHRYERRLIDRISRLDENLRAVRDVERAKSIIMSEKKLDEQAAYRHLRDLAMRKRESISAMATAIVQQPQLFS